MKYVVIKPECGLGNRLLGLWSSIILCDKLNIPYKIWWEPIGNINCKWNDLFDWNVNHYDNKRMFVRKEDNLSDDGARYHNILIKRTNNVEEIDKQYDVIILSCNNYVGLCGEKRYDIINNIKSFCEINKHLYIKSLIWNEVNKIHITNCLGVHVRRGDIVKKFGEKNNPYYISLETYVDYINNNLNKYDKILLSCEDEKDEQKLLDIYGDKIIYRQGVRTRKTANGIIEALIHILLLSRCTTIIGGRSSFSDVASYIGNTTKITLKNIVTYGKNDKITSSSKGEEK